MRRVPQEAFLSTECVFRTVGGPLRYRILRMSEKRRALLTPNSLNCQKRGAQCKKRSPGCRREQENHSQKVCNTAPNLPNATRIFAANPGGFAMPPGAAHCTLSRVVTGCPYTRKAPYIAVKCFLERKTGLGPATSTLARLRSTN